MKITGYIERDLETGFYIATVPSIPEAHTEAATMDELLENLKDVVALCMQELPLEDRQVLPEFIGIQQMEIEI